MPKVWLHSYDLSRGQGMVSFQAAVVMVELKLHVGIGGWKQTRNGRQNSSATSSIVGMAAVLSLNAQKR